MRVLIVNVYYPPIAFGGATIVAEQTTTYLSKIPGVECLVLCLDAVKPRSDAFMTRYEWQGVDVIATSPSTDPRSPNYKRSETADLNRNLIDNFDPDVALVHCIQDFGAEFIIDLFEARVPVAIFVHDAWWLCERQFMVNPSGAYCFQNSIDLNVCRFCVDDIEWTRRRDAYLRSIINRADARLFPSAFIRDLYLASGMKKDHALIVKNGVSSPARQAAALARDISARHSVRFGFIGGLGPAKGSALVEAVFKDLPRTDYELVCVDNVRNIGRRSVELYNWKSTGSLRIRNSFTSSTIDEFYREIDVLLCPSQCKESFGLSVREALIRHKWVVVTDAGGITEDIIPGVNGTIIPMVPDPQFLREAVLQCFDRDWRQYRNVHSETVRTFADQSSELYEVLSDLTRSAECQTNSALLAQL
jgi:O-antigen biosynthesis protein